MIYMHNFIYIQNYIIQNSFKFIQIKYIVLICNNTGKILAHNIKLFLFTYYNMYYL